MGISIMNFVQHLLERRGIVAGYLALITLFLIIDPLMDYLGGEGSLHISIELLMATFTLTGLLVLLIDMRLGRARRRRLESDLLDAQSDVVRWRAEAQELLSGLGQAIDRQFQRWCLTPAERDVGILLLKGLSHKEVADIRNTSERTVRQQAREIYRKAEVSGRAELSAWFLEDLLLPDSAQAHRQAPEAHSDDLEAERED
jgi:DNA-binding CsgD family transcriptional regulator